MDEKQYPRKKMLIVEIVEDEPSQRKALVEKFTMHGFSVLEAKDGEEGLKIAEMEKPDIIILDIKMPKLSGMGMLNKLRQKSEWGKHVPVIILTNLSPDDEETNRLIVENQPSYYLMKANFSIDDIVRKVKEQFPGQ